MTVGVLTDVSVLNFHVICNCPVTGLATPWAWELSDGSGCLFATLGVDYNAGHVVWSLPNA